MSLEEYDKLLNDLMENEYTSAELEEIIIKNDLTTEFENNKLTFEYTVENVMTQFNKKLIWTTIRDFQVCEDWFIEKYHDELMFD